MSSCVAAFIVSVALLADPDRNSPLGRVRKRRLKSVSARLMNTARGLTLCHSRRQRLPRNKNAHPDAASIVVTIPVIMSAVSQLGRATPRPLVYAYSIVWANRSALLPFVPTENADDILIHLRSVRVLAAFKQLARSAAPIDIGLAMLICASCKDEIDDLR